MKAPPTARRSKPLARFLGLCVLTYGLALLPWPGWNEAYARYFCALGRSVLAQEGARRIIRFEALPERLPHALDVRIMAADRARGRRDGVIPARALELDARAIGWIPTALVIALVVATPIPWRRRFRALLTGLILVHGFILASLAVYLWSEAGPATGLGPLPPFWRALAAGLESTLITNLGASFVAPVLIWIGVAFRRQDLGSLARLVQAGAPWAWLPMRSSMESLSTLTSANSQDDK